MTRDDTQQASEPSRRNFLRAGAVAALAAGLAPMSAAAGHGHHGRPRHVPKRYPDSVWKVHDKRFGKYMIGNTQLYQEWIGSMWAEGSAWNHVGRYVVFSDIPNNRQMRWDEITGRVTEMRRPSNFSNGNTFDFQGR